MAQANKDSLPFEAPLQELKGRIEELLANAQNSPDLQQLLRPMQEQYRQVEKQLYENLDAWNTVQLSRHPKRPTTRDFIELSFDAFEELHGDRSYRDDLALVTGLAQLGEHRVMLIAQHRGRNVAERHQSNAGCTHPEGYWKANRKMRLAEKFHLPVVCLIDTKGAYPGIGSEERGVALAIAENLRDMSLLRTPIICCITGEGGSGGALGICVGDRVLMLRHAWYSVISPEGCASILWRDGEMKDKAAAVLKLTSRDLLERGFINEIVAEPLGGAHRDPKATAKNLREALIRHLNELVQVPLDELVAARYDRFRAFGEFLEGQTLSLPPEAPAESPPPAEAEPAAATAGEKAENPELDAEAPPAEAASPENTDAKTPIY